MYHQALLELRSGLIPVTDGRPKICRPLYFRINTSHYRKPTNLIADRYCATNKFKVSSIEKLINDITMRLWIDRPIILPAFVSVCSTILLGFSLLSFWIVKYKLYHLGLLTNCILRECHPINWIRNVVIIPLSIAGQIWTYCLLRN